MMSITSLSTSPPNEAVVRMFIAREFPDFTVLRKSESALMKAVHVFLLCVSFGQMRFFLESYVTTLGTTVYVPRSWEALDERRRCIILRHEAIHMRQSKRIGRFWFSCLYLFAYFPVVFAWFRAQFEMEAYAESLRAEAQYFGVQSLSKRRDFYVSQFTGPAYLWMWPFRGTVEAWFNRTVEDLWDGYVPPDKDRR